MKISLKKFATFIITALMISASVFLVACEVPDVDLSLEVDDEAFGDSSLNDLAAEEMPIEPADALMVEVAETEALKGDLKQAFVNKYQDWDIDNVVVELSMTTEGFATGGIGFADSFGGGYFYAANTAEGWVIAWDGQDLVDCADIEPYDFPTEMIAYCYDYENGVEVER